jgi:transposase
MTRGEEITALYGAGHGQRAISRHIGISQPAVRKWLLRLGLPAPQVV